MERFKENMRHWNCSAYRKKYPDLKDMAHPRDLLIHALTIGMSEGREFEFDQRYFFPKKVIERYGHFTINMIDTLKNTQKKVENSVSTEFFEENYTVYILRHMNDEITSKYWKLCYQKLRALYPNIKVVVVDDNSLDQYTVYDSTYQDVTFYYSQNEASVEFDTKELTKRGELLPFYYYYTYGTTKYALFLHDSVFINSPINDFIYETDYLALWNFQKHASSEKYCTEVLESFDGLAMEEEWAGVFGGMSVISRDYIEELNSTFDFLLILLYEINERKKRMTLERLLGICYFTMRGKAQKALFGDIHCNCAATNMNWGLTWEMYQELGHSLQNMPIVKVWSGR